MYMAKYAFQRTVHILHVHVLVENVCDPILINAGSDSDEARFRRRKSRSMKKVRRQCLPMNFDPEELSQPIVRDRQRIGASLADVDPMAISRQVP